MEVRSANCTNKKHREDIQMGLNDSNSLSHTKWNCKYHIVFAPKYRRKVFYQGKREAVGMYPISEDSFLDMGEFEEMRRMEEKLNMKSE